MILSPCQPRHVSMGISYRCFPKTGKLAEPHRNSGMVIPTKAIQCLTNYARRFMQQNSLVDISSYLKLCIMQRNSYRASDFLMLLKIISSLFQIFSWESFVLQFTESLSTVSSHGGSLASTDWCEQKALCTGIRTKTQTNKIMGTVSKSCTI